MLNNYLKHLRKYKSFGFDFGQLWKYQVYLNKFQKKLQNLWLLIINGIRLHNFIINKNSLKKLFKTNKLWSLWKVFQKILKLYRKV
jgi:hypothetical protein